MLKIPALNKINCFEKKLKKKKWKISTKMYLYVTFLINYNIRQYNNKNVIIRYIRLLIHLKLRLLNNQQKRSYPNYRNS